MITIDAVKQKFVEYENTDDLDFEGYCSRCGKKMTVLIEKFLDDIKISGGALIKHPEFGDTETKMTCDKCFAKTEVYSRVVGYMRPINSWNDGKLAEYSMRKTFDISECGC